MPDYSKGKIYKIINDTNNCYIGSTTQKLEKRLRDHYDKKQSSRILLNGNEKIILIKNFPCNNLIELIKEERKIYDEYKNNNKLNIVNTLKPYTTLEEKKENKRIIDKKNKSIYCKTEKYINYQKKYREKNREQNKQYQIQYKKNRESWGKYNNLLNISMDIFN